MIQIGVTGTRKKVLPAQVGTFTWLIRQELERAADGRVELHHGDCIEADYLMHCVAKGLGCRTVIHPPRDPKYRAWCVGDEMWPEKEYLTRNRDIVECGRIMIAMPNEDEEQLRSGTWSTIRYARKLGREVRQILRDGTVRTLI